MNFNLTRHLRVLLSLAVLCCYTAAFVGCSDTTTTVEEDDHEQADDGGHDGHDHPAHGPNGGHMVELSGGAHAEWVYDNQKNDVMVYVEKPEGVSKVEMKVTIGEEVTSYEFEAVDDKPYYQINSPNLLTAVTMGEGVKTELVVTREEGAETGPVVHHSH